MKVNLSSYQLDILKTTFWFSFGHFHVSFRKCPASDIHHRKKIPLNSYLNKANLRDLIAATDLVILLKLDINRRFFSPCDLEIWWMTPKNNRAPLLCYFKLFASFLGHRWIQTGVTVRKRLIWVKINFFSHVTLKFDGWPSKTIGHLFLCYFKLCAAFRSHWWIQTGVTVRKCLIWV